MTEPAATAPLPEAPGPAPHPASHPAASVPATPAPAAPILALAAAADPGISGLSPPPLAVADPAAPAPPMGPPPPPPTRQVAQATITLALGSGQAPRLTVALEPEALGRVEIRIERGAEGEPASVRVLAERPETLALLQRDQRELDRSLSLAGLSVPEGGLQFGLSAGGEGGGRQAQGQGWSGGGPGRGPAMPTEPGPAPILALSLLDIAV